jgi:hypothetical protein
MKTLRAYLSISTYLYLLGLVNFHDASMSLRYRHPCTPHKTLNAETPQNVKRLHVPSTCTEALMRLTYGMGLSPRSGETLPALAGVR